MSEDEDRTGSAVELLLLEPEIVAWLEDYRPPPDEAGIGAPTGVPDVEPPAAA